jgi:tetratricopeptide (TPR) repeat protein
MKRRHSTQGFRAAALALTLSTLGTWGAAADEPWLDYESRIQFAFYEEDARALGSLAEQLAKLRGSEERRAYYAALANYRISLLDSLPSGERAAAAEGCVATLDRRLDRSPDSVELLALQGGCLAALSQMRGVRAPLASGRSRAHVARALGLAPTNPRALLVEAASLEGDDGLATLQSAVTAFEKERHGALTSPGWGAAEAYAELGRRYLEKGEVLQARDAVERALLIAPEYAVARRLLERITSG